MLKDFGDLTISHVVAAAEGGVIGRSGELPWHIPEDFKIFKQVTMGKIMVMGRKTFESIGRPLPGRLSIVITRDPGWSAPAGVHVCQSVEEALALCQQLKTQWGSEVCIIGGGQIFASTFSVVDKIYYTAVHLRIANGDTFYPEITPEVFQLTHEQPSTGDVPFTWRIYTQCNRG
ncbi:MAG: dihydrofolate reductase [Deltaproteobacteria bacterium]|nr:dihydrofolate reductase [Deltaproteobacteria bacterium]